MKMKKVFLVVCLAIIMTGCGKKDNNVIKPETTKNQQTHDEEQTKDNDVIEPEATKNQQVDDEEEIKTNSTTTNAEKFSFADLKNSSFEFASGAGAWGTELYIYKDGSFDGLYHDSDMGDTGDGYPDGKRYISEFSGKFDKNIEVIDEYTVKIKLKSIQYENEVGTEELADNVKYIYSEAYGLNNTDTFYVYLPGKPISELNEDVLSWIHLEKPETDQLEFYVVYNEKEGDAFYSYNIPVEDTINSQVKTAEDCDQVYSEELKKANTQLEMNLISEKMYKNWDKTLNVVWKLLSVKLSESEMEALRTEEREWIKEKEAQLEKTDSEGGSAAVLDKNILAGDLTKARVYELQKNYN